MEVCPVRWFFNCELDMCILVIDVLEMWFAVFCLSDDKGVIHKP